MVIKKDLIGKIPLSRSLTMVRPCQKKIVNTVKPGKYWKEVAKDKERWQLIYLEDLKDETRKPKSEEQEGFTSDIIFFFYIQDRC